eukprot:gene12357-biopygen6437
MTWFSPPGLGAIANCRCGGVEVTLEMGCTDYYFCWAWRRVTQGLRGQLWASQGLRPWASQGLRGQPWASQGSQDSGAGVARAWRGRGAGYRPFGVWVARAWRGHGAGVARACPVTPWPAMGEPGSAGPAMGEPGSAGPAMGEPPSPSDGTSPGSLRLLPPPAPATSPLPPAQLPG